MHATEKALIDAICTVFVDFGMDPSEAQIGQAVAFVLAEVDPKILSEGEGDALEEIGDIVLAYFERECPGHIETMFCGTLADYPLLNQDWAQARHFWDVLLRYRMCRQEILDEFQAKQILAELRCASAVRG